MKPLLSLLILLISISCKAQVNDNREVSENFEPIFKCTGAVKLIKLSTSPAPDTQTLQFLDFDNRSYITDSFNRAGQKIAGRVVVYDSVMSRSKITLDTKGRLLNEQWADKPTKVAAGAKYAYDAQGNIIKRTIYDFEGKPIHVVTYTYKNGRIMQAVVYSGGRKTLTLANKYDDKGRKTEEDMDNTNGTSRISTYTYYSNGNIKSITRAQGDTQLYTFDYDAHNNPVLIKKGDDTMHIIAYTYDSHGNWIRCADKQTTSGFGPCQLWARKIEYYP